MRLTSFICLVPGNCLLAAEVSGLSKLEPGRGCPPRRMGGELYLMGIKGKWPAIYTINCPGKVTTAAGFGVLCTLWLTVRIFTLGRITITNG